MIETVTEGVQSVYSEPDYIHYTVVAVIVGFCRTFQVCRQQRLTVNIRAGIVGHNLLRIAILSSRLNGAICLEILRNKLPLLLEDVLLAMHKDVWFRRHLHLKPYRFTMVQHIADEDKMGRRDFCVEMLGRIEENETLLNHVIFSDESTFHVTGKYTNCRIWGSEPPHLHLPHVRDSPKMNVFCAFSKTKVYGPLYFQEETINCFVYLDMLPNFLIPQIDEDDQTKVKSNFSRMVHLHTTSKSRDFFRLEVFWSVDWSGGPISWPPRSPDLTPLDLFLWGSLKINCTFHPYLPISLRSET
ncbi:hypothetical protein ANN_01228 [Periplaneta americana]|uniref:Uncharacterized protein n=1 Tax=Periplaneta americana TaxID=6978 RepID=A0ABQ8TVW1_PERAM|nr:hypothetical protein ANN_01228 [Periplaneta americana]